MLLNDVLSLVLALTDMLQLSPSTRLIAPGAVVISCLFDPDLPGILTCMSYFFDVVDYQ